MSTHAIHIRRALESEAPALSALAFDAKQYWRYSPQDIERWGPHLALSAADIAANPTFVAELDAAVVGFYLLVPGASAWALEHLWVSPSFARRGIGRALFTHAVTTARRAGASSIAIDADPNAEPFYAACGAVREGVVAAPTTSDPARVRPQLSLRVSDCPPSPIEG
jgi:GNAT superfamily N-acetyltransferase